MTHSSLHAFSRVRGQDDQVIRPGSLPCGGQARARSSLAAASSGYATPISAAYADVATTVGGYTGFAPVILFVCGSLAIGKSWGG